MSAAKLNLLMFCANWNSEMASFQLVWYGKGRFVGMYLHVLAGGVFTAFKKL